MRFSPRPFAVVLLGTSLFLSSLQLASAAAVPDPYPRPARINYQNDTPNLRDFVVGPTRYILPMKPGEERTVELQITNRMGAPTKFDVVTEDFFADPQQQGTPSFFEANLNGPYPARLWLTPELHKFSLNHADRAFINVTVKVPLDAEPGDHQAAVIIKQADAPPSNTSGINIVPRLAALFIVSVEGDTTKDAQLVSLYARKHFNWALPVSLGMSAKNDGTVHFSANGTIEIRNIFGIMVDELPVKNWIVLRNSARSIDFTWQPRFALGRYTAMSNITLYDGAISQQVSTSFWVIPLLPLLIILFTIFFVSYLVQYFFSRFEIRKKDEPEEPQAPAAPPKEKKRSTPKQ
jgi:hypothetical protein